MAKKILVVEDDPLVIKMYQTVFENAGMEVFQASNGDAGYESALEHKPDLVLCDIMMPGSTGLNLLEQIKENKETKSIPVVILTNMSGNSDKQHALDNGAVDFWIKKDMEPRDMVKGVKKLIG